MPRRAALAPLWLLLLLMATYAAAAFLHPQPQPQRPLQALTAATTTDDSAGAASPASSSSSSSSSPSLFVFGLGYVGRRLAAGLAARGGWRVQGTSTKPAATAAANPDNGVQSFAFDPTAGRMLDAAGLAALHGATHLLVSVPPLRLSGDDDDEETGDAVLACCGDELRRRCPRLEWIGYLSSTSVYGDRGGGWVSESDPPAPVSRQGLARVRAEEGWTKLVAGWGDGNGGGSGSDRPPPRLVVFRLAGIYGPGRSALDTLRREVLEAGEGRGAEEEGEGGGRWPLSFRVDGERPVSRVHVDDIVRAVRCALETGTGECDGGGSGVDIFNIADDRPASRLEVFSYAARLLASGPEAQSVVEVVPQTGETGSAPPAGSGPPPTRTRSGRRPESKRVDNRRMKEELLARCFPGAPPLLYKDYEAGLAAIWEETGGGGRGGC